MNILIESPFAISARDKKIIESRINYLMKYEARIIQVSVFFKKGDGSNPKSICSQIRIEVPGHDLFAEKSDVEAIKAFSGAYSSIKRQVKERRKRFNDHQSPIRAINEIVNNTY